MTLKPSRSLRTLKDIFDKTRSYLEKPETELNKAIIILVNEIEGAEKELAIKWVKYYQKKKFIDDEAAQWLRMWIIKFFNITKEDLK